MTNQKPNSTSAQTAATPGGFIDSSKRIKNDLDGIPAGLPAEGTENSKNCSVCQESLILEHLENQRIFSVFKSLSEQNDLDGI